MLLRRFVHENGRAALFWSLGLAALVGTYLPFYPSIGGEVLAEMMAQLPAALQGLIGLTGTLDQVGYVHSTLFGLMGPLLLIFAAASWGARAVAGDEEAGTLELTLSYPVTRTQVVWQRAAATALLTLLPAAAVLITTLLLAGPAGIELSPRNVVAASAAFWLLGLLFGNLSLLIGAATGRAGAAAAVTAAAAVAAYLLETLGAQSGQLRALRPLSPFNWAFSRDPLRNGFDVKGAALLLALSAALLALSALSFSRRDLKPGA